MKSTNKFILRKRKRKIFILLGIVLAIFVIIDLRLRPIIKSIAANKASTISTHAINDAVLQELDDSGIKYSSLVNIERTDTGKVIALTTNSSLINRLKSKISIAIQNRLSESGINRVNIPLGTLLGTEMFCGLGPCVPLKISISGSVVTEFESKFCEAGINQTKHQIYLNIHTRIGALIPGYPVATDVDTNMNIAETVIVGEVPNVYVSGSGSELGRVNDLNNMNK